MRVAVLATLIRTEHHDYRRTVAIPTFYLDGAVQGFTTTEGADFVAREIVDPFGVADHVNIFITEVS